MKNIILGSKNPVKVRALKKVLGQYEIFKNANIFGVGVESGVAEQPMTLSETIQGAKNRALKAFEKGFNMKKIDYSFGIESGFMRVAESKVGYLEVTICAIYDGEKFSLGFSPAFEVPKRIMNLIITKKLDLSEASLQAGYTDKQDIGVEEGIIGVLTKGKITREEYTKYAIMMAMIYYENN